MKRLRENIWIVLILVLGFILRFNYDIFISGYNFDEIAIIAVAKQNFPLGILKLASNIDYHAPLYQLIIHFFTYFEHEWVYVRLFNLILSLINIYVFYKIGKLIKNKTLGYILALILTVNHLEISMVSFIKFYVLAFLLFSASLYYLIKIIKLNSGYKKLGAINAFFIFSNTFGFVVIFFEYLLLLFLKKEHRNSILKSALISSIGFILYLPVFISQVKLSFNNIISPHSYYVEFSFISLCNALNDYFSPLLNYCCNLITIEPFTIFLKFYLSIMENKIRWEYLITLIVFSYIPVITALICIIFGAIKNKIAKQILYLAIIYLIYFITITKLEITGFIPIYLFALQVMLLILAGVGIAEIKNIKLKVIILLCLIFPQIFINNCYPPQKRGLDRTKNLYCIEKYYKKNKDAKLIVTTGGRFLYHYYKDKDIIELDSEKMSGLFQREFIELIYGKDFSKSANKKNIKDKLEKVIKENKKDKAFEKYFIENILNKTKKNEKITLVIFCDKDISFITDDKTINQVILGNNTYNYNHTKGTIKEALRDDFSIIDTSTISSILRYWSYKYLFELMDKYFKKVKIEQYTRDDNDDFVEIYSSSNVDKTTLWYAQNCASSWIFITYVKE